MPTYEFRCPDGTIVERIFKMSEAPASIPAPDGSGIAVRIISGGADLIFKGSGFYITDYGKDGKKDQRASKNEGSKSEDSGSKKDESKKSESSASADSKAPAESKAEKSEKSTEKPAATPTKSDKPSSSGPAA